MNTGDGALALCSMLADPSLAGAYFVAARNDDDYLGAARTLGFAAIAVDFSACTAKDEALARIATALRFPDWFGGNWDALADCLADLSWWPAPGYVLLLASTDGWSEADPGDFDTFVGILEEAAGRWAAERIPFWALMPSAKR